MRTGAAHLSLKVLSGMQKFGEKSLRCYVGSNQPLQGNETLQIWQQYNNIRTKGYTEHLGRPPERARPKNLLLIYLLCFGDFSYASHLIQTTGRRVF